MPCIRNICQLLCDVWRYVLQSGKHVIHSCFKEQITLVIVNNINWIIVQVSVSRS